MPFDIKLDDVALFVTFGGTELRLQNAHIKDITELIGLEKLTSLKRLYLDENEITEIKGLETLKNLTTLNLSNNRISEIKGLETLENLTWLNLSNNRISEIKSLEKLRSLKRLYLEGNEICEIKGLETLGNLDLLNLSYSKISEIRGLEKLTSLEELFLQGNEIRKIKGLDDIELKNSNYLTINLPTGEKTMIILLKEKILKIEGLSKLTTMRILYLDDFVSGDRKRDLCRNYILKTYSASETIWWGIKHIIINIYIPILIMLTFVLIMFLLRIDPLSLMQNILFWLVLGVSLFFIVIYLIFMFKLKNIPRPIHSRCPLNPVTREGKVKIGFVGDIMPTGRYNIRFDQRVKNFFSNCDLIVGNLEGIMVKETSYEKIGRRISTQRHALTIMKTLESLGKPPEDWLLCVSNNHSGDLGIEGFVEMLSILKGEKFNFFGNEDNPTFSWPSKKPVLNFVTGTMWSNYRKCRFVSRFGCVSKYHDDSKFNILFPHWHYENEPYIRPTMGEKSRNFLEFGKYKKNKEIERFYNNPASNPFQSGLNEWDFIYGHHSHTPQPIEVIKRINVNKVIAYSGGNFTSGKNRKKHRKGIITKITLGESSIFPNRIVVDEIEWRYTYNF